MANGIMNGTTLSKRMWTAANSDVAAGNLLDRLTFCVGYLAAELDKRDAVIEELRGEVRRLKEATADDGR